MRKIVLIFTIAMLMIALIIAATAYLSKSSDVRDGRLAENDGMEKNNDAVKNRTRLIDPIADGTATNLTLPPMDEIENSINWSKYPSIGYHYVDEMEISEPTEAIPHNFLYILMRLQLKSPDDIPISYREMSGVARDLRAILGPNSDPKIYGEINGIAGIVVGMLPYSSEIYRVDYYHPISDLTWSNIDASELE